MQTLEVKRKDKITFQDLKYGDGFILSNDDTTVFLKTRLFRMGTEQLNCIALDTADVHHFHFTTEVIPVRKVIVEI